MGNERSNPHMLREVVFFGSIMLIFASVGYLIGMSDDADMRFLAVLIFLPALPGLSFQKDILQRMSRMRARMCIAAMGIPGLICSAMIVSGSVQVMKDSIVTAGIGCVGSLIVTSSFCVATASIVRPKSVEMWQAVKPTEDDRGKFLPPFF
ncbi:MAG: hypothetical protein HGA31_05795 [Candidatus Moranbacteria bacterium]|nr:hypothetical protein [Candidatus Moranbacteria bacterium]